MKKKKLKQTNASAHLIQLRFKIREGSLEKQLLPLENWKDHQDSSTSPIPGQR